METKDLASIALSIIALFISGLAWRTAKASFRLAEAQDRRAQDREKPLLEIDLPYIFGRGPIELAYKVTNRGPEPIQIVGFRLPIGLGRAPLTERAPFRFADSVEVESVRAPASGDEAGNYELARVGAVLQPGEAHEGKLGIVPEPRDRVRPGTELRMHMDVIVRNREATAYSLPILRNV